MLLIHFRFNISMLAVASQSQARSAKAYLRLMLGSFLGKETVGPVNLKFVTQVSYAIHAKEV